MAQQDPPRRKPIKIGGASPPTEAPPPQEPRQVPMSLSGFVENVAKNAKAIAGGVVDAMTQSAKSTAYILKNAEWLPEVQKHPEFLGQELKNTGSWLVKAIVDPYRKHGIRVAYEEPLTVVADAMSLLSGGGGLAAKGGKLMGLSKLEKAGKALEAIPGKLAQGIADKTVQAVSLGSVNPASRRALLLLEREERTIGELTKKQLNKVLDEKFKGFSDADKALLDKLAVEGGNAAELAANPKVKAALEAYDGIVKEIRQKQLGEEGRRLLTTEQMEDAVAKKYANRKYGSTHGDALKQAKDDISRMEVKPVYTPAIGEGKKVGIMDLIWGPDEIRLGKVGFLEKFKGGKFSQDPIAYMRKAVDAFVDEETRLRFMDRVIQDPKLTKASFKGESALGHVVPEGISKRYWDDRARAQAIGVRDIRLKHGVAEAERLLLSDPVTQKYVKSIAAVGATDPTVANYLKWTFTRASGRPWAFLRVYDKILGVFKTSATIMNPRYYTGNLVGDAILTTMAGEYGLHWRTAKRLMDSLPPELRAGGRAIISENPMLAKFQKVSDIAQAADDLARAGIWTKDVARKFKEVGGSFAAAEQTFDDFFKAVGGSVEDLSNLQMKSQLLDEKIALQSQEILKLNQAYDRKNNQAIKELNKLNAARDAGRDISKLEAKYQRLNDTVIEIGEARDKVLAAARDHMKKSGEYYRQIPEAQKYAEVARQATDRANAFLGDYFGLGPIERAVFRRVIPFYSFTKAMTKLAFTYPFIAPKSAFFWHRYSQSLADMAGDPDMPDWMAGYFPVGGTEEGDTVWIRLAGLGPMGGVRTGRMGDAPVPSMLQFWNQNPIISLGYRMAGGRDEFYWAGKQQPGKVWVNAGDGRIHRFRADGTIETVVPQMSFVEGLSRLFPTVQVVDRLISNYDVYKGPVQNPDGTLKYPSSIGNRIGQTLGVSSKTGSADDFSRSERNRVLGIFKDLERQYPRFGPEEREYVRGLFEDYRNGYFRKFKGNN